MNQSSPHHTLRNIIIPSIAILLMFGASLAYAEHHYKQIAAQLAVSNEKIQTLASTTISLTNDLKDTNDRISQLSTENAAVSSALVNEQTKNSTVQAQIGQIFSTADTLTKLSKTDPQLLQKYSKVFFLNEHYVPTSLTKIPTTYAYNGGTQYQIHSSVYPRLEQMIKAAKAEGVTIQVISAYRSFGTQAALKSSYKVTYGAGTANSFSADQGYSEHQLGTTLDFTTPIVKDTFDNFDKTPEYNWLTANAYKYGFILSYPQSNTYYEYEPWHWRYVGIDLATRLHRDGKNFYDVDQRVINDYLPLIFD